MKGLVADLSGTPLDGTVHRLQATDRELAGDVGDEVAAVIAFFLEARLTFAAQQGKKPSAAPFSTTAGYVSCFEHVRKPRPTGRRAPYMLLCMKEANPDTSYCTALSQLIDVCWGGERKSATLATNLLAPNEICVLLEGVPIEADEAKLASFLHQWLQRHGMTNDSICSGDTAAAALGVAVGAFLTPDLVLDAARVAIVDRPSFRGRMTDLIGSHKSGYMVIVGLPGAGKTTILASIAREAKAIVHFNRRSEGIVRPAQFLQNVTGQILIRYKAPSVLTALSRHGQAEQLDVLFEAVAPQLSAEAPLVLAVDGLDEAELPTSTPGANALYLPEHLPPHVFVICTTRPASIALRSHAAPSIVKISDFPDEVREAATQYIETWLRRPSVQSFLKKTAKEPDFFAEELLVKSEGNFMYLWYVFSGIEDRPQWAQQLDELPLGLPDYYEQHWRLMEVTPADRPMAAFVVYALCEAEAPLTIRQLSELASCSASDVARFLEKWAPFLNSERRSEGTSRYSLYHESFRDFLQTRPAVEAAGIDRERVQTAVTDHFWNKIDDRSSPK
jgi:hypothetical protein